MIDHKTVLQITGGHDIVRAEDPEDVDVEDAEAELDARGEDLDQHGAGSDNPAPTSLNIEEHYNT